MGKAEKGKARQGRVSHGCKEMAEITFERKNMKGQFKAGLTRLV